MTLVGEEGGSGAEQITALDSLFHHFTLFVLFSRDPQRLDPPEVSDAKLQYAGWGPKGQQLVSKCVRGLSSVRVTLQPDGPTRWCAWVDGITLSQ